MFRSTEKLQYDNKKDTAYLYRIYVNPSKDEMIKQLGHENVTGISSQFTQSHK